jgi:hypothetical protein
LKTNELAELRDEVGKLKERNSRVELDKEWETSWARRLAIFLLTYSSIFSYFHFAGLPNPLVNSLVPALAFALSTLSLPFLKDLWVKRFYVKQKRS